MTMTSVQLGVDTASAAELMPGHRGRPRSPHPLARAAAVPGPRRVLVAVIVNLVVLAAWVAESTRRDRGDAVPSPSTVVSDASD